MLILPGFDLMLFITTCKQGCGSGYFINRFRFQQSLASTSSMNLLTSMTIKTSSLRFTS